RGGQIHGAITGAFLGGYVGGAIGEGVSPTDKSYNDTGAYLGLALGAMGGAWLGGAVGDRMVDARPLYESQPSPAQQASIGGARAKIDTDDLLRIRGSFGEFAGYARGIDADGLSKLDRDLRLDVATTPPP